MSDKLYLPDRASKYGRNPSIAVYVYIFVLDGGTNPARRKAKESFMSFTTGRVRSDASGGACSLGVIPTGLNLFLCSSSQFSHLNEIDKMTTNTDSAPNAPLSGFDAHDFVTCARYGELDELKALVDSYLSTQSQTLSTANPATLRALYTTSTTGGNTALHMAAANGEIEVLKYLLPQLTDGDVNQVNDDGSTALHWAALNGKLDCVELLLSCGADATIVNSQGRSAVTVAEQQGHMEVVNVLLKSYEPEVEDDAEASESTDVPSEPSSSKGGEAAEGSVRGPDDAAR